MLGRLFVVLLLLVALVAGYPYANVIMFRVLGTHTGVLIEQNGPHRTLISGPNAPRPDWLPILPGSIIVTAAHWVPGPGREIAGSVELLTHRDVDEVKRFYMDTLTAVGFDMRDIGYGLLTPQGAAFFGIDNYLQGCRRDLNLTITVTLESKSGSILRSRTVSIHWQKWEKWMVEAKPSTR